MIFPTKTIKWKVLSAMKDRGTEMMTDSFKGGSFFLIILFTLLNKQAWFTCDASASLDLFVVFVYTGCRRTFWVFLTRCSLGVLFFLFDQLSDVFAVCRINGTRCVLKKKPLKLYDVC